MSQYNSPPGVASTVGPQINVQYYQKQALIEARKEQYFTQLADSMAMPKNFGKKIKRYIYVPLLDDQNINDQGIDAAGVTTTNAQYYVTFPEVVTIADGSASAAVTTINANINNPTGGGTAESIASAGAGGSGGAGRTLITLTKRNGIKYATVTTANAVVALNQGVTVQQGSGNLYGSSKDIGTIAGKMPALSENGGRVNRVGFKRKELEGSLEKFGFFDDYTKETMDFDTDADLEMHINREMLNGANEITEDKLQIDLINGAQVRKWAGAATSLATVTAADVVTYGDLMRLSIDLDNNRTPKQTTMFTGTRQIDTKTIPGARAMYIGSELLPLFKAMKDLHNNPAFISVEKYAAGGNTMIGEVGAVDQWRLIVVPHMMKWAGSGADATSNTTHYKTNNRFDVFPLLCVGEGSFTTISFQTDGKDVKFVITHKKPGVETADRTDPYGETGFMSIKGYYGFMVLRGERLALLRSAATL
jgi:N4-gp56 family major capsid protein